MPLLSVLRGAKVCTANSKRTKLPCNNPAAHGCKTCRMHGARRPETIIKGKDHHAYKHGKETRAKRAIRQSLQEELAALSDLAKRIDDADKRRLNASTPKTRN